MKILVGQLHCDHFGVDFFFGGNVPSANVFGGATSLLIGGEGGGVHFHSHAKYTFTIYTQVLGSRQLKTKQRKSHTHSQNTHTGTRGQDYSGTGTITT